MGRYCAVKRAGSATVASPVLLTAFLTQVPGNPGNGGWTGQNLDGQNVTYRLETEDTETPGEWLLVESDTVAAVPETIVFTNFYISGQYYRLAVSLDDVTWVYSPSWQYSD